MSSGACVIGIDLGTSDATVGYARKGVVDIVQNRVSQRKNPSLVSFLPDHRLVGDSAQAQMKTNLRNTCRNFKHLLGRNPDDTDESFWLFQDVCKAQDDLAGYSVQYREEALNVSATQVTAMFLKELKEVSENWTGTKISDAVISVPGYFRDVHRQALLDACEIAGMNCLRLINEHTAAALAYGIYRTAEFSKTKPYIVAFVSCGHACFTVAIARFWQGKLEIVSQAHDRQVSGRHMDRMLMEKFAGEFEKKYGLNPLENVKARFKLEEAVQKTKKTLSSNVDAPISIECLMQDCDFQSSISRDEFERISYDMRRRIRHVVDDAIGQAKIMTTDIDSIEIIGGSVRVPGIKQEIRNAFEGKELMTTLNLDEAVAKGCALAAAILSPMFKVRDFAIVDTSHHGVSVSWTLQNKEGEDQMEIGESKPKDLFPTGSTFGTMQSLTFLRRHPLTVFLNSENQRIAIYDIHNQPNELGEKIRVRIKLTLNGTYQFETPQIEKEIEEVKYKEKKELVTDSEEEKEKEKEEKKEENEEGEKMEITSEGEKKNSEEPKKPKKKKEKIVKVEYVDKKIVYSDLEYTAETFSASSQILNQFMDFETEMQSATREVRERCDRRNDLEAFVFQMRSELQSGKLQNSVTDEERENYCRELQKCEDWIYDNYDAKKVDFIEKMEEVERFGKIVLQRHEVVTNLTSFAETALDELRKARLQARSQNFEHVEEEKLREVLEKADLLEKSLEEVLSQQSKRKDYEGPVCSLEELQTSRNSFEQYVREVLIPKKEETPAKEKEDEDQAKEV